MRWPISLFFVAVACFGIWNSGNAQADSLLLVNSQAINDDRYDDIKGSPFLFKEPVKARIIRNDANIFDGVWLNYNGFTKELEVRSGDQMIELDRTWYLRVEIAAADNPHIADEIIGDKLVMQRGIHQKFRDQFTILLFVGDDLFLIRDFDVEKRTNTVQDVGKSVEFEKFNVRNHYYIKRRGKLTQIRLKKNSVIDALDSPEVEAYIKSNKLRCSTVEEVIQVLEHFNTLQS
ncbi:MAG: hypothetical protein R3301_00445 [Saprospiraceae bacterium]|nr:hypothetical protein [Saprospiraceae bacterium]